MNIKIGILDSGIDLSHKNFNNIEVEQIVVEGLDNTNVIDYHGTAVFDVLRKSLIKNNCDFKQLEFYDIKVFNEQNDIKIDNIAEGIYKAMKIGINILNVSLGLMKIEGDERLLKVCKKAFNSGMIIVAASDNQNKICYPAYYPFCLGIAAGVIDNLTTFGLTQGDYYIKIIGKGSLQRVATLNGEFRFEGGTSMATAHISGIVTKIFLDRGDINLSFEEIKRKLRNDGLKTVKLINDLPKIVNQKTDVITKNINEVLNQIFRNNPFCNLDKISIYPCSNKEFINFINFKDYCKTEVIDFIDYPRTVYNNLLNSEANINIKRNLNDLSESTKSIVIGYPFEIGFKRNDKFYYELIDFYEKKDANIIFLEKCIEDITLSSCKKISKSKSISIQEEDINKINDLGVLNNCNTPVLAVVGSTSRVGKFTYQILLKKYLEEKGYKVGWLSTESQGYFFGANYCFPYGTFASSVTSNIEQWPDLINNLTLGLEKYYQPDIIISGHQSGLIPLGKNIKVDSIKNLSYLAGLNPDAVICIMGPNDDMDYYKRLINSIKYYFSIPIISVVLNDLTREFIHTDNNLPPIVKHSKVNSKDWSILSDKICKKGEYEVLSFYDNSIVSLIENFFSKK